MISKNLHIVGANMIKLPKKILASSMLGGMVEFYDFTIYGFFAPIIGPLFFPSHDALVSTLLGYAVFAVGFIKKDKVFAIFSCVQWEEFYLESE
jgi:hypothetical protein